jgi:hypothetical protein
MGDMARHEKGQILLLTLIILTIGAIIMGSLLIYLNTSMSASEKSEVRALTYYAADSGFEDGYFWLQQDKDLAGWNNTDGKNSYHISDHKVDVMVEDTGDDIYRITSTATYNKSGESTTVESYVLSAEYGLGFFGDDAITSNCSVTLQPSAAGGDPVQGNVTYVCDVTCKDDPPVTRYCPDTDPFDGKDCCEQSINGTTNYEPGGIEWWPPTELLISEFSSQVDTLNPFNEFEPEIDAAVTSSIGPLYYDEDDYAGKDLEIVSTSAGAYLALSGTVYVAGDLQIGQTSQDFTLHLGNQTIFAEGEIWVGGKTTITGWGSIIALGDVNFQPDITTSTDNFVFIMSAQGGVTLHPLSTFYGSIAGHDYVDVAPNINVIHNDPEGVGFVFPDVHEIILDVKTYNIKK